MARRFASIIAMAVLAHASAAGIAVAQMTSPGIGPPSTQTRPPAPRPGAAPAARAPVATHSDRVETQQRTKQRFVARTPQTP